ncbi:hypothetical protein LZ30DRAFT_734063 [Colletotrichum cereale]|nr:hypothetical protein LZ30DRAFT_734063 [Colletotrichum cereale]
MVTLRQHATYGLLPPYRVPPYQGRISDPDLGPGAITCTVEEMTLFLTIDTFQLARLDVRAVELSTTNCPSIGIALFLSCCRNLIPACVRLQSSTAVGMFTILLPSSSNGTGSSQPAPWAAVCMNGSAALEQASLTFAVKDIPCRLEQSGLSPERVRESNLLPCRGGKTSVPEKRLLKGYTIKTLVCHLFNSWTGPIGPFRDRRKR